MSSDEFTQQLQMACRIEGQEHVQLLLNALVKIEFASESELVGLVEQSFRSLHNIKGSAHAAEFYTIESLCHPMEDVMAAVKAGELQMSSSLIDILLEGVELVDFLLKGDDESKHAKGIAMVLAKLAGVTGKDLDAEEEEEEEEDEEEEEEEEEDDDDGRNTLQVSTAAPSAIPQSRADGAGEETTRKGAEGVRTDTLQISTDKLDLLMQKAEEMLSLKTMTRQNQAVAAEIKRTIDYYSNGWSKAAPDVKQARELISLMLAVSPSPVEQMPWRTMSSILDAFGEILTQVNADVRDLARDLTDSYHATSNAVDSLLDDAKSLLMISCSSLFAGFPIVARQLARQLGKEIEVTITGGDIEMDRRLLGQIKDPLIHIIRNSIDHGIETPAERIAAGKDGKGSLVISAQQVDRMVEIRIADDGKGIDSKKVKASAVKQGLITGEEASELAADEALRLIFKSALSTSPMITEISGRGLGLAIVEQKIQDLGGSIAVETEPGKGTSFIMRLPMTIATFRGVLVEVAGKSFVFPTNNVDRVVTIKEEAVKAVDNTDTFLLEGTLTPLASLEQILQLPPSFKAVGDQGLTITVVRSGQDRAGLIVDEVVGEQEVLVKALGPIFGGATGVLGATVLGSGQIVPILNIAELVKTFRTRRLGSRVLRTILPDLESAAEGESGASGVSRLRTPRQEAHVLVVDDMVTARMLMRNIFESAGFKVTTANNGLDALKVLREMEIDVVVTDLEMPHMDGFRLTESIRADAQLKTMPVVILTSMASRADRERGVAAGANAYFVKSSFDQANLLDVVGTLV